MMAVQAYVCDPFTGAQLDRIPCSAFPHSRLLSAGDSGSSVSVPLDGTYTQADMAELFRAWNLVALERDGVLEYMGYIVGDGDDLAGSVATFELADIWAMLAGRGAWNHHAPNVEAWSTVVSGSKGFHAAQAILRGRTGPALPDMRLPLTLPGSYPGPSFAETYYGYHLEMVGDVLSDLLAEGLDAYFRPRWIGNGDADWLFQAGDGWSSGVVHEFFPTVASSEVVGFSSKADAIRVTNNAYYVGEGSEVDMLVRSNRNTGSPFPLRDRITQAKNISNVARLSAMATNDLSLYAAPTVTWSFQVLATHPIDVGDTARLYFDGHRRIPDGWQESRVVKVAGGLGDVKTVSVQPTGGA